MTTIVGRAGREIRALPCKRDAERIMLGRDVAIGVRSVKGSASVRAGLRSYAEGGGRIWSWRSGNSSNATSPVHPV